ncbi:MAG TPA: hypothetical protein VGI81_06445 [Tepidisphaeraceae bacterium]|jgi:hypothetical protein
MATDSDHYQPPSSESLAAGYEKSGVSVKALAIFLVCLIVVAAIVHAGVWFLFSDYLKSDRAKDRPMSALTDPQFVAGYNRRFGTTLPTATTALPPPPRIQPTPGLEQQNTPAADLQQMYREEDAVFHQMGWRVDERTHVPLEIPPSAVSAVIQDVKARQGHQPRAMASPPAEEGR